MPAVTSQRWPGNRAVLLCHGVGNYAAGDYEGVREALRQAVGPAQWDSIAVYEVYYDHVNDWFTQKNQVQQAAANALGFVKGLFDPDAVSQAAAEGAADVLWPVLSLPARDALRRTYIAQVIQMVLDGVDPSGHAVRDQKIVLIGHSLGCFHTYEALWSLANDPQYGLQPAFGDGPIFQSTLLIASPIQLMRSVAGHLGGTIPERERLATTRAASLAVPFQSVGGRRFPITRKLVSLTGTMDPVGGHLFGRKVGEAYMSLADPLFEPHVEAQHLVSRPADADLMSLFAELVGRSKPDLSIENPHSWERYVANNGDLIRQCVLA